MLVYGRRAGGSKAEKVSVKQGVMKIPASLRVRLIPVVASVSSAAEVAQREDIREFGGERRLIQSRRAVRVAPEIEQTYSHRQGGNKQCSTCDHDDNTFGYNG